MAYIVDGSELQIGTKLKVVATPANSASVTRYGPDGRDVSLQSKATYSCVGEFTPAATPTDMVMITGSPTKTIRVVSMYFTASNTLGGVSETLFLNKRVMPNFGGTFVAATAVPFDSLDAAATAQVGHYTANPTTLGQIMGTINSVRVAVPPVVPTTFGANVKDAGVELLPWFPASILDKMVTLRGVSECMVVNFNSAALFTGEVHAYRIVWTEE